MNIRDDSEQRSEGIEIWQRCGGKVFVDKSCKENVKYKM